MGLFKQSGRFNLPHGYCKIRNTKYLT
jgi:hypothetical protein